MDTTGFFLGKKAAASNDQSSHFRHLVKMSSSMFYGTIEHYKKAGLQYADVPAIVGISGACENVDTLFKVGNRLDLPLFFTQTGQLALELALQHAHGVYTIIHSGRDEEEEDARHLRQFRLTEEEFDCTMAGMTAASYDEETMYENLLAHIESATKAIIAAVVEENQATIAQEYRRDPSVLKEILARPYLRVSYEEAVAQLQQGGYPELSFGDDLGADQEAKILELVNTRTAGYGATIDRWSPVSIMRYPKEIKFFNMKVSTKDPRVVLSADCIFPFAGEAVGAAVREHDGVKLIVRLLTSTMFKLHEQRGGSYDDFKWYTEAMILAKKTLPHAGYGVGNERIVQFLLGTSDIRECSVFHLMSRQTGDWDVARRGMLPLMQHRKTVLLSIGKDENKRALLPFIKRIRSDGNIFYATDHTHTFLAQYGVPTTRVYKISEEGKPNLRQLLQNNLFDLIVNIPTHPGKDGIEQTDGSLIRKAAVETGTTIITDADIARDLLRNLARRDSGNGQPAENLPASLQPQPTVASASPIYDISKTYEENTFYGPYWHEPLPTVPRTKKNHRFLGYPVQSLFGVAACPLTANSRFIQLMSRLGYDIITYKSVRSIPWTGNKFPHWMYVDAPARVGKEYGKEVLTASFQRYENQEVSIANSFGMHSPDPEVWKDDVNRTMEKLVDGQLLILSLAPSPRASKTLLDDVKELTKHAAETKAKVFELNLACPNTEGQKGLLYDDVGVSRQLCEAVKGIIGNKPLIAKVGFFRDNEILVAFLKQLKKILAGVATTNALSMNVVSESGDEAFPGRPTAGAGGAVIRDLAQLQAKKFVEARDAIGLKDFVIIGIGGVTAIEHIDEYLSLGVDAVQSATGAWADPLLAVKYKSQRASLPRAKSRATIKMDSRPAFV